MKKSLLLLAAMAVASSSFANNTDAVKKQLDADYKTVASALKNNQIDKMTGLMTDDYVIIQKNGQKFTKAQVIAQFRSMAGQLHNTKWTRTIKSLSVSGNQAVAIVDGSFAGEISSPKGGPAHKLTQTATTKDTWVKTPKGYRLQKSEVQKNMMTMDGKAMPGQ